MKKILKLQIGFIFIFLSGCATTKPPPRENDGQNVIGKKRFLALIESDLIAEACMRDPLLKKCIPPDQCSTFVSPLIKTCLEKFSEELPDEVDLEQARTFGKNIGICTQKSVQFECLDQGALKY